MTVAEFQDQAESLTCQQCQGTSLTSEHNPNNNGQLVVCPTCHSHRPLGHTRYLKKNLNKTSRKPAPIDLEEVWVRFGNVCAICGAPRSALEVLGIGRQAHHVMPYAQHGHQGPLIPLCSPCHETATARQRVFWWWHRFLEQDHAEPVSERGTEVSRAGLSPDSVSAAGQASAGGVEGVSSREPDD